MKSFKNILIVIGLILGIGAVLIPTTANVAAWDPFAAACPAGSTSSLCTEKNAATNRLPAVVNNIVNILLYILAAISVVFIIMAGIFYTTSGGNAANVKKAKDTLLYSVIGLVVAILAYAIVKFVITYVNI